MVQGVRGHGTRGKSGQWRRVTGSVLDVMKVYAPEMGTPHSPTRTPSSPMSTDELPTTLDSRTPIEVKKSSRSTSSTGRHSFMQENNTSGAYLRDNISINQADRLVNHIFGKRSLEHDYPRAISKDFKAHCKGKGKGIWKWPNPIELFERVHDNRGEVIDIPKKNRIYGFGLTQEVEYILSESIFSTSSKQSQSSCSSSKTLTLTPAEIEHHIQEEFDATVGTQVELLRMEMKQQMQQEQMFNDFKSLM